MTELFIMCDRECWRITGDKAENLLAMLREMTLVNKPAEMELRLAPLWHRWVVTLEEPTSSDV